MSALRWAVTVALVVLALVLQVSLFPHFTPHWFGAGVVPNLCLLVVVATALVRGPEQAAVLGFVAGVLLDLAPPADHVAGRCGRGRRARGGSRAACCRRSGRRRRTPRR